MVVAVISAVNSPVASPPVASATRSTPGPRPTINTAEYRILDPRELAKNPGRYRGTKLRLEGEVFQIQERSGRTDLQMWVTPPTGDTFDRVPVMVMFGNTLEGVYERSQIEVFGIGDGERTGTNAFGAEVTQPVIRADRVTW
jgi:hypothetical protein